MTVRRIKLAEETYQLGALRLYREDLRAVAAAVAEVGELKISCDDSEADAPGDFDGLPETVTKLTITATRADPPGGMEVNFTSANSQVKLTEPDALMRGILSGIRLICEPRTRHIRGLVGRSEIAGFAFFIVGIAALIVESAAVIESISPNGNAGWSRNPATIVLSGVGLLAAVGYFLLITRPKVVIINAPRADRPTYWQRTKYHWQVGIVTTVAGVIAGYLLAKL
jgi:hypothetical protein